MAFVKPDRTPDIEQKVEISREIASGDVADCEAEISHLKYDIRSKKQPPSAAKLGVSSDCIFNCAYCSGRCSREDVSRFTFEPSEIAEIALAEGKRRKMGIFITSGIYRNADYTQELIAETVKHLRINKGYKGYIHAKVMPGASPELIRKSGLFADRLSVNIEVAKSDAYTKIAKNKTKKNILTPMQTIHEQIQLYKKERNRFASKFASSQSTQLMAGSSDEDDRTILQLSGALYSKYKLSRVYYTAFQYRTPASGYDFPLHSTPAWRVGRLYQADRLLSLYGFTPDEITPESDAFLKIDIDPKADWALRNLELFPIEINKADINTLLRIPGIGHTYAKRIVEARKYCNLSYPSLVSLGVNLKKARHFITCGGVFQGSAFDNPEALRPLISIPKTEQIYFDSYQL